MMSSWKLFEFFNHIDYLRRSYETSCITELEKLIREEKMIRYKVTDMVKNNLVRANEYVVHERTDETYDPWRKILYKVVYSILRQKKEKEKDPPGFCSQ